MAGSAGSNPAGDTYASAGGRRFESCPGPPGSSAGQEHQLNPVPGERDLERALVRAAGPGDAALAQLAERSLCKRRVIGSKPLGGSGGV